MGSPRCFSNSMLLKYWLPTLGMHSPNAIQMLFLKPVDCSCNAQQIADFCNLFLRWDCSKTLTCANGPVLSMRSGPPHALRGRRDNMRSEPHHVQFRSRHAQ